ncbi:MAG: tetratricopeptide repeat protein [Frankia sp.]|nr:tetratricopeptide repeat protein [Frankia sp.]
MPHSLAAKVASHLVAAAMLLDDDPRAALAHARFAATRASRLPATREAAGIAAYRAGEYAVALVELRAARRMDGSPRHLPLIADSERGLGRPERAIEYLNDPAVAELDPAGRAELLIVASGARRDMGQPEAAVVLLREEATRPGEPRPWTARLRYAYAEALLAAGHPQEALRWFESAAAIDEDGETDADERAYELMTRDAPDDADASAPGDADHEKLPAEGEDAHADAGPADLDEDGDEQLPPDLADLLAGLGLREVPAAQRERVPEGPAAEA